MKHGSKNPSTKNPYVNRSEISPASGKPGPSGNAGASTQTTTSSLSWQFWCVTFVIAILLLPYLWGRGSDGVTAPVEAPIANDFVSAEAPDRPSASSVEFDVEKFLDKR